MRRRTNNAFVLGAFCGSAATLAAALMFGVGAGNAGQVFVTSGHDGRTAHAWEADASAIRYIGTAEAKKKEGGKEDDEDKSDKGTEKGKGKGK